ncbi:MAG: hypothetical protein ACYCSN_10885 [Acidobacteriaceae bacterium]
MRKALVNFEDIFFFCSALATFIVLSATILLRPHLHIHNSRIQYGLDHLTTALIYIFLFIVLVGFLRNYLSRINRLEMLTTPVSIGALIAIFSVFWLPVLLAGGFVQDDWMLLSAASIRKIIYHHPIYSWYSLDTVDGNFRPLGTVLYFSYMLKFFGLNAIAFLSGNFMVSLSGSILAFFIVRELGYSSIAGMTASILYMSRGMIYTPIAWASALGDGIVILLCGLTALAVLRASKSQGIHAILYHLLAWCLFFVATLAKQSAFAMPLIIALLILVRPGAVPSMARGRRIQHAVIAFLIYSATASFVFLHAKALLQTKTPYPIALTLRGAMQAFSYVTWYFFVIQFPDAYKAANELPVVIGIMIVAGVSVLIWRTPQALGPRPRDIAFAVLAALASISMFTILPTRGAAYYGSMAAFWVSIGLGIALTRYGAVRSGNLAARICCFAFCLVVISGFFNIRIMQTGLIPSGGYIWGTYGMSRERSEYEKLATLLAQSPQIDALVFVDGSGIPSYRPAMALLADPNIRRIMVYDSGQNAYFGNDLQGNSPKNQFSALNDARAYNWKERISHIDATQEIAGGKTLWIGPNLDRIMIPPAAR